MAREGDDGLGLSLSHNPLTLFTSPLPLSSGADECGGIDVIEEVMVSSREGEIDDRKKLRLSKEQAAVLEETFKEQKTVNPRQKMALAKQLNLRPRQVEVWFQNTRARTKLKQTEVECEYMRRYCENLTEENRRLQKEVNELSALKLVTNMSPPPPTTLTMCPQCQHHQRPPTTPHHESS
ncbi:homeobox-leucine zipper protein HAT4-like [Salvia hispanica]|uniref:homeobox-leucine zipper protein HAT4-like n=1 Tax=Salvia hispanica TaxID=49212 RepID=UPI002009ABEA|nr:homeobox-leucine zipper protein HAT4-like [Salvia hispanica]